MKPTSYCTLKRQIQLEVAKNRKITQQFMKDLQKKQLNPAVSTAVRSHI